MFLSTISTAQNRTMELWPAHTFRVKLNKQFKIDVENQLRANISTGELNQFFLFLKFCIHLKMSICIY